jgi:thiol-disulfide isomerase/thioredoxin
MYFFFLSALVGCMPSLYTADFGGEWVWEPPENQWCNDEPPAPEGNGSFYVGERVPDFRLVDQYGDEVSLWQFVGKVVLLDVSTMWCSPCQELGSTTQETWEHYNEEGEDFVYITVLQENVEGQPPSTADINVWVDGFGIGQPVLADGDKTGVAGAVLQGQYPALIVIDRDLTMVERVSSPTDAEVHAALDRVFTQSAL